MTSYELLRVLSAADDEALLSAESLLGREEPLMKTHKSTRIVRTLLIAAVFAALLGATAFAAGWLTQNPAVSEDAVVYRVERQEDGSVLFYPDEDARRVSLTRFLTVPEDLDPAVREKAENNLAAWEEASRRALLMSGDLPEALRPPEGCTTTAWESHADGSATLRFYCGVPDGAKPGQRKLMLIETRRLSPEQVEDRNRRLAQFPLGELLEEYGLKRRGTLLPARQMLSIERLRAVREQNGLSFDPELVRSDERYCSDAEIAARTEELFCHAPLFRSLPACFDRVCWYGSGDFSLSWTLSLAEGAQADCFAYVGRYDVFHTGDEIFCVIPKVTEGGSLRCTAADGTELGVLLFGEDAVLYAFLPEAYFCEHVHADRALTEADLRQIADFLNCSAIGVE